MGCAVSELQTRSSSPTSVEQNEFTKKKAKRPRLVAQIDDGQQNEQEDASYSFPSVIREDKQLDLTMTVPNQQTPNSYIRLHVYSSNPKAYVAYPVKNPEFSSQNPEFSSNFRMRDFCGMERIVEDDVLHPIISISDCYE